MKFLGYERPDGQVGVRNYIGIIPSVFCSNHVAEQIANRVKTTIALTHPLGCSQVGADLELTARTLIAMGNNPNLAAVLVVGLGCERFTSEELCNGIAKSGKPVERIVIQEEGDTLRAIEKGVSITRQLIAKYSQQNRTPIDVNRLIIGVKCGGTDATSGITANPAIGKVLDRFLDENSSGIFSEVTELLGTEDILAKRAINEDVAEDIKNTILRMEDKLRQAVRDPNLKHRSALISTGNFDGGVSTVVEKALGNIYKSGTKPIQGVIRYAETPRSPGLFLMDSPGHDGEVVTGMVGSGAQIILFSTGRGTPTGFPFVPVIKITGNEKTFQKMNENIDINVGRVISGNISLEEASDEVFDEVLKVASGKLTKSEIFGHKELFCISRL